MKSTCFQTFSLVRSLVVSLLDGHLEGVHGLLEGALRPPLADDAPEDGLLHGTLLLLLLLGRRRRHRPPRVVQLGAGLGLRLRLDLEEEVPSQEEGTRESPPKK